MIGRYQALAQRIRQELAELDPLVETVQRHWNKARTVNADRDAFVNSVALNLHSFYSGLERIFERIATDVDGIRLGGERWHAELLNQMTLELPRLRRPF